MSSASDAESVGTACSYSALSDGAACPTAYSYSALSDDDAAYPTAYSYSALSDGAAYPTADHPSHYPNSVEPPPEPCDPGAWALICFLTALFVVTMFLPLILYLIMSLVYRLPAPAFAVSSASVSAFNLSIPQHLLSSDFDISFSVVQNHESGIYYKSFAAAVFYGSYDIAKTSLPPFYQDKWSAITIRARIVAAAVDVEDDVAKGIAADRGRGDGVVNFNVKVFAWVEFVDGERTTMPYMMSIYCDDVPVGLGLENGTASTVGSLVGAPKQCKVDPSTVLLNHLRSGNWYRE